MDLDGKIKKIIKVFFVYLVQVIGCGVFIKVDQEWLGREVIEVVGILSLSIYKYEKNFRQFYINVCS